MNMTSTSDGGERNFFQPVPMASSFTWVVNSYVWILSTLHYVSTVKDALLSLGVMGVT